MQVRNRGEKRGQVCIIQAVARVDDQTAGERERGRRAQSFQLAPAIALVARVRVGASVQLDDGRAERGRSFDLRSIRIDEKAHADLALGERLDGRRKCVAMRHNIESAFGGHLAAMLGHEADVLGMFPQGDCDDLRRVTELEVELGLQPGAQPRQIGILQVPPVRAQMHGDGSRPGLLAYPRRRLERWFGVERIRMRRVARLPQSGDVVDIDTQMKKGRGHGAGPEPGQHCGISGELKRAAQIADCRPRQNLARMDPGSPLIPPMTKPPASPDPPRVLVADDQADVLTALKLLCKGEGLAVDTASSPAALLAAAEKNDYAVVLMDLNYTRDTTSGREGLDVLEKLQRFDPTLPVIVMTAWGTINLAVEAVQRGAKDFIQKPWENARLIQILRTQIELHSALRRAGRLEAENKMLRGAETIPDLVAKSAAMRPVLELVERVGPSDANVLITGENGTGKGVIARALHAASSRASRALVTVNMGGLSEGVFESELFGHVKGAFTDAKSDRVGRFELADGGTLFLDEIANMTLNQQAKLLRVLETGEYERVGSSRTRTADVRILSATNSDLKAEVAAGKFRQDLLFRLNTIEIHVPPLRDRAEDVPALADFFLRQQSTRYRKPLTGFDPAARAAFTQHNWPGNVRELSHCVERAVLMARERVVHAADLGLQPTASSASPGLPLDAMSLEDVEALLIKKALARYDGSARLAAEAMGLSRSAFYRRLQKYGL